METIFQKKYIKKNREREGEGRERDKECVCVRTKLHANNKITSHELTIFTHTAPSLRSTVSVVAVLTSLSDFTILQLVMSIEM